MAKRETSVVAGRRSAVAFWKPVALALGPVLLFAASYLVALKVRTAQIAAEWAQRPEIENWALPETDARPDAFWIALGVTAGAALLALVGWAVVRVRR